MNDRSTLPLVYSCSGASSAAQMANYIAVRLDRLQVAEMSCIAGVGGDVKPLVRTAKSGRPIIALDGCPLHCAAQILKRHGLVADGHFDLSKMGVRKRYHEDFDLQEANRLLAQIQDEISRSPGAATASATATRVTGRLPSSNPAKPASNAPHGPPGIRSSEDEVKDR